MPFLTRSTLAPTRSQRFAISFMKEMRVASIALAAYFVISADGMSMKMIGLPVRTLRDARRDLGGRHHRHRGLRDDDELALHVHADLLVHRQHVAQVGRAVF